MSVYDIFDKCCTTKCYPIVGETKVYMRKDENMGKCLINNEFVTPNMPKLHYAINFYVNKQLELKLLDTLNPKLTKYKKMYVYEKHDGFNWFVLFIQK